MPNWTYTKLRVEDTAENIAALVRKVSSRFVPEVHESTEAFEHLISNKEDEGCYFDFNCIIPKPKEVEEADYTRVGHQWECDNWGVKWGACHGDDNPLNLHLKGNKSLVELCFDTPWSFAEKTYKALSKQFPTMTFHYRWLPEDHDNKHSYYTVFKGGRKVVEKEESIKKHFLNYMYEKEEEE